MRSNRGEGLGPEVPRVELDPSTTAYRMARWVPLAVLTESISTATSEALIETDNHIWSSTERLAAFGVGSWMAVIRQTVGHNLLLSAEQSAKDSRFPLDIASMAHRHYQEAEKWLQFREIVYADQYYRQDKTIDVSIQWPEASLTTPLSPELLKGLKATADELILVLHPPLEELIVDSPITGNTFKFYKALLKQQQAGLLSLYQQINSEWSDTLHPHVEPGTSLYRKLTQLIEGFAAHGVNEIMPIAQSRQYLAAVRQHLPTAPPDPTQPHLPFQADAFAPPPRPPQKPFRPEALVESNKEATKPFSIAAFLGETAVNTATGHVKPFDPEKFEAPYAASPVEPDIEPPKKPFNPEAFGSTTPEASSSDEYKKPFDPEAFR